MLSACAATFLSRERWSGEPFFASSAEAATSPKCLLPYRWRMATSLSMQDQQLIQIEAGPTGTDLCPDPRIQRGRRRLDSASIKHTARTAAASASSPELKRFGT